MVQDVIIPAEQIRHGLRMHGIRITPQDLTRCGMEETDGPQTFPVLAKLRRDVRYARELEKKPLTGYFIEDLENFDAAFFGISPIEAEQMDPHQRLALELSWEALENAGVDSKSLSGLDTAVFHS
ncbi:beta-ketoacyl synthase [Truncatella angustata]|uniref:Beta-ketoacyl synthase n=1 Tax=Truncatella angustata TaxID=152316 RepID=A0A9P8RGI9_9PEZI|nr:beta-ketoacyl synthase [Truncatella angustata]KAH6645573.1 beta-ketoacyl synthase [Truncatella angustata]